MSANRTVSGTVGDLHHPRRGARRGSGSLLPFALAAMLAGCTSSGQSGSAFVTLSVVLFSLNGSTPVGAVTSSLADRNASTIVCVTLQNNLKNPTVTTPTGLDNVLIQSYTVRLTRLDGGPAPASVSHNTGVTVPAGTVTMGSLSGNTAQLAIIVVPAQLKNQSPLNGAPVPLNATADVTFKGRDGRGQSVTAQGAVSVVFVGDGTDAIASCAGGATAGTTGGTTGGTTTTTGTTGGTTATTGTTGGTTATTGGTTGSTTP